MADCGRWDDDRLDDLKETVYRRFDQADRALREQFTALRREMDKAEDRTKERLDAANKFRQQMIDDRAGFLPRELFDTATKEWTLWRNSINERMWTNQGQHQGVRMTGGTIIAVITAATAVIIAAVAIANALSSP